MEAIFNSLITAIELILSGEKELWNVLFLTLKVSLTAVTLGALVSVPLGTFLGLKDFKGKSILINLIYTFMALPPVLIGLVVFLFLSRSGPIGELQLLFTPTAMVVAQFLLAVPIITGLTMMAITERKGNYMELAITLGANRWQIFLTLIREAKSAIFVAIITGFGRLIAEVGAVMMVGGNIMGETRVLTTAIVLESRKGNMEFALALGLILLLLAFTVIFSVGLIRGIKLNGKS